MKKDHQTDRSKAGWQEKQRRFEKVQWNTSTDKSQTCRTVSKASFCKIKWNSSRERSQTCRKESKASFCKIKWNSSRERSQTCWQESQRHNQAGTKITNGFGKCSFFIPSTVGLQHASQCADRQHGSCLYTLWGPEVERWNTRLMLCQWEGETTTTSSPTRATEVPDVWHQSTLKAFPGEHQKVQQLLPDDIIRCYQRNQRARIHAYIQSSRPNLPLNWITSSTAKWGTSVFADLLHGGFCQRGSEKMFCHAWYLTGRCHWLADIPPLCQSLH